MVGPRLFQARGAGDFAVERRERALRKRLSEALLGGAGTVWGLAAGIAETETGGLRTRVLVSPGVAIDAVGREIYVDREQCLDVDYLVHHAIWRELTAPPRGTSRTARRAYIVLRHEAGQTQGVPAATAPGREPPAPSPAAPVDRFRIELCPAPPPDPHALRHDRFAAFVAAEHHYQPRDVRLDLLMQERPPRSGRSIFWTQPDAAPLLLATLDLDVSGADSTAMAYILPPVPLMPNPDNRVRAALPGARLVAEALFGKRLFENC